MKLFERTGGYWLFWTGAIYLAVGLPCALYYKDFPTQYIQIAWILCLSLPFIFPPLGRWLNMSVEWDKNMFDWLKSKTAKEYLDDAKDNVYTLPKPKAVPPIPEVTPPKKEAEGKVYYRLGLTDNNRVSFQMGYSEITMNAAGCQQVIDQLEFFKSQLYDDGPSGGPDGDGGEPLPVPEESATSLKGKKAA